MCFSSHLHSLSTSCPLIAVGQLFMHPLLLFAPVSFIIGWYDHLYDTKTGDGNSHSDLKSQFLIIKQTFFKSGRSQKPTESNVTEFISHRFITNDKIVNTTYLLFPVLFLGFLIILFALFAPIFHHCISFLVGCLCVLLLLQYKDRNVKVRVSCACWNACKDGNVCLSFVKIQSHHHSAGYHSQTEVVALTPPPSSHSPRCPSTWRRARGNVIVVKPGRRRRPTETPPRATNRSTRCWGRRACSGPGVWAGRTRSRPAEQSASPSRGSTCTAARSVRSSLSWSRTAWSTWACPPWDTVRRTAS